MATTSGPVNLAYAIVALAVVVIIISTVALPIIADTTQNIDTEANNATQVYTMASGQNVNLSVSFGTGTVIVNDYEFEPSTYNYVLFSDSFVVQVNGNTQTFYVASNGTQYTTTAITVANKTATFTASGNSVSLTYDDYLFYAAESGSYGYFAGSGTVFYCNADSVIYHAQTKFTSTNAEAEPTSFDWMGVLSGTGGVLHEEWAASRTAGVTISGTDKVTMTIAGYTDEGNGSYKVTMGNSSLTVTASTGTYTTASVSPSFGLFAPIKYTYVSDSDAGMITLLNVIPILLILTPIMMAVGLMRGRS